MAVGILHWRGGEGYGGGGIARGAAAAAAGAASVVAALSQGRAGAGAGAGAGKSGGSVKKPRAGRLGIVADTWAPRLRVAASDGA